LSEIAFRDEEIAVGGSADFAREIEAGRIEIDLETGGRLRPGVGRAGDDGRSVAG
jgi:hypothetical protein